MNTTYKEIYQAYCPTCRKLIGRVRKYHDYAVEAALKHEDKVHGRHGSFRECRILSSYTRPGMIAEANCQQQNEQDLLGEY